MKNNIIRDGSKDGFKVVILKMKNIIEKANANFCETIDQAGCSGRSSAKRQVRRFPLETGHSIVLLPSGYDQIVCFFDRIAGIPESEFRS